MKTLKLIGELIYVLAGGFILIIAMGISVLVLTDLMSDKCHAQSLTGPENFADAIVTELPTTTKSTDLLCCQEKTDYSWTGKQILAEATATSLLFVDYKQTIAIQTYQGNYDTNPILGPHPNNRRIKNYFGAVEVVQLGGEMAFPILRLPISGGIIVVEGITTARNRILGFTFKW